MNTRYLKTLLVVLVLFSVVISVGYSAEEDKGKSSGKNFLNDLLNLPLDTIQNTDRALTEKIFNLGEIKVSSARVPSERSEAIATDLPHNVTIIGEKQIKDNASNDVPNILTHQEGVTYTDDIGQGLDARVDLRSFGGEAKQALVLFDGLREVEPFDNSVTWHLYPAEYLSRIEIQRGGGSTVYGEGAFSGVIQLKTKEPTKELKISTENTFGDFQTIKNFAETSGTVNGVGFYIGGRYLTTDGYRQNADHEGVSTLAKVRIPVTDLITVENSFYFADNTTGIPGPLTAQEVAQNRRQKDPEGQFGDAFRDRLVQNGVRVDYFIEPIGVELSDLAGYRLRDQDSVQSFGGFFGGTNVSDIGTETFSNVLQAARRLKGERYESNFTGGFEWSTDDIHNPNSFNSFSFGPFRSDRSIDRRMTGTFIQNQTILWDRLILESGLRQDTIDWNIYDLLSPNLQKRKTTGHTSPKAGVEFKIWEALGAYGSFAESFKVPDSNALIFETPNLFSPNPNLDPQVARHYETGLRYAHPTFGSVRADYFYIETKKEILFNDISNLNENFDTIRQGVEIAGEVAVADKLQLFFNYTYAQARFDNGPFDEKDIPLVPESHWSGGLLFQPDPHWMISAEATGVHNQFALNDFNNLFPVKDYWTLGGRVSYRQDHWEVFFRAQNILGEEYSSFVTSNGVDTVNFNPAPTHYLEVGFKMDI